LPASLAASERAATPAQARGQVIGKPDSKGSATAAYSKGGKNVFSSKRARYFVAATLLAASACAGNRAFPTTGLGANGGMTAISPDATVDTTSVLKKLTKNVTIGSTVDPTNGDKTPHGIVIAPITNGVLKKGQILACNFSNKASAAGAGTTIEALDAKAGSKPARFVQNAGFKGCGALGITAGDTVFGSAFAAQLVATFDGTKNFKYGKTTNSAIVAPFGTTYADIKQPGGYDQLVVYTTDAKTGSLVRLDTNDLGPPPYHATVIVKGFAVNKKAGLAALAPSGLAYNQKTDTLYIVDGVDGVVVGISGMKNILALNAITVLPGGKTFKYVKGVPQTAKVVYSGTALKSPVAATLLPNGNLIIANTAGNSLVEMTPTGQILDTKVVDTKPAAGIFSLVATGTNDADTVLYYTDANTNTVQLLTK
jgi:hypothetical protein